MDLFARALEEFKQQIIEELEKRIWERLEPRIEQQLHGRHMSVAEAADYLHVSGQTVRKMIKDKEIPCFRIRSQIFIRQVDVDALIERQLKP